ncbi:hypothetical protein [Acidianus manzaensis]|uniref:hypothetical protein n=1 Tax=Acidianus manzaensis TaxID=282676 RepID=UPI003B837B3B
MSYSVTSRTALINHIRYTNHPLHCMICKKKSSNYNALLDHICKKHNICIS